MSQWRVGERKVLIKVGAKVDTRHGSRRMTQERGKFNFDSTSQK